MRELLKVQQTGRGLWVFPVQMERVKARLLSIWAFKAEAKGRNGNTVILKMSMGS